MGSFSLWHWVVVFAVIAIFFGTGRLKNIGKDLGTAIKGFREGISDIEDNKINNNIDSKTGKS